MSASILISFQVEHWSHKDVIYHIWNDIKVVGKKNFQPDSGWIYVEANWFWRVLNSQRASNRPWLSDSDWGIRLSHLALTWYKTEIFFLYELKKEKKSRNLTDENEGIPRSKKMWRFHVLANTRPVHGPFKHKVLSSRHKRIHSSSAHSMKRSLILRNHS